jgi:disulfide bond formation protein DsbB
MALLMGGMLERSWQLLGTERGWIFGSCNMDAGLPAWFALDRWFPAVFEVKDACGYTPELLFGVTMAEALLLFSLTLTLLAAGLMVISLLPGSRR